MASRLLRYAVLAAVLLGAGVLLAQSPSRIRPPRSIVTMSLEDEGGERLRTYSARGQTFVLGRHGQRYNVRVHNQGPERVEIVLAVDGRDAVSGQTTDLVRHRGYVVPAYGSVLVQGFRTSMQGVASFRFTDPSDSYSARMGTPQHVGIIQVAVFEERPRDPGPIAVPDDDWRWQRRTWRDRSWDPPTGGEPPAATPPAERGPQTEPGAAASEARQRRPAPADAYRGMPREQGGNLGTEFGEHRYSRVVEVDFERATPSRPAQWLTVRYDDEQGLLARGIEIYPRPVYATPPPPPWPPTFEPTRFAPPPPAPRHRPWYSGWDW